MSKATNQAGPIKSIIKKGDASKFFSHSFTESEQNENNTTTVINPGVGISIEGEAQVFEWLKSLGFRALLMRDRSSLFNDPFRNGTLLCHVIGRVENERMHSLYKDPKSIDECRHNVYQAFQVLVRKQTPIPSYLKGKEEAVLRGDRSVILALLYSLMKINESKLDLNTSVITNNDKLYKQETSMYIPPYDDNDIERLERSLIGWMNSMGLFNDLPTVPHSLKELAIHFRNGVMLCDLTTIVTNARLTTIHRRPANENQCITNIRRALEILRTKKMMGQRYLWKEREIYNGNKFILLGLLEDLHRFFDGTAPRANPNYFLEGPYVPKPPESYQDERNVTERLHTNNKIEFVGIQPRFSARLVSPGRTMVTIAGGGANYSRRASRDGDMRPPESSRSRARETQNPKLNISSDEPISIIDYERKGGKASVLNSPTRFQNGDTFLNSNMSRWESYSDNLGYKSPRSDIRKSGFPTDNNYPVHSAKLNEVASYKSLPREDKSPMASDGFRNYRSVMSSYKEEDLKEWIMSLGFGPQIVNVNLDANILEEFKDGILLCKIIEALELKAIPGLILKPKTNASKVVNIRKCLNALSKRPGVNPHYLHIEDKILAGDGDTIRKLLVSMREGYKFMNKCIQRTQSPSSSRYIEESMRGIRSERKTPEKWTLFRPQENYVLNPTERKAAIIPPKFSKN